MLIKFYDMMTTRTIYEVDGYSDEFAELQERVTKTTEKQALNAGKKMAKKYAYVEVSAQQVTDEGDYIEGKVIQTYRS